MPVSQTPILRDANPDKNAYRGLAMSQMRILKDYMKLAGLNTYSRVVTLANGVVITCKVCFNREDVFVFVPPFEPMTEEIVKISLDHLLFFNGEEIWGFNWETGDFENRGGLISSGSLVEGYGEAICLIDGEGAKLQAENSSVTAKKVSFPVISKHITRANAVASFSGNGFEVTTKDGTAPLLGAIPDYTVGSITQMSNAPVVDLVDISPAWNNTKTHAAAMLFLGKPEDSNFVHRWVPRVFYPELGNPILYPPSNGLFYGRHIPTDDIGTILSYQGAEKIVVHFGGYFDDRYLDDDNWILEANNIRAGYCETVESLVRIINDTGTESIPPTKFIHRVCFFMAELWTPSTGTFYSKPNGPGYKTVQSTHQSDIGKEHFVISYKEALDAPPIVHWWSSVAIPYDNDREPPIMPENRWPLIGILATEDMDFTDTTVPDPSPAPTLRKWALHSYRGVVQVVAAGEGYLGHSVSTNGEFVAVFTGVGTIADILVYDLKENKQIISKDLSSYGFTTGVIIPTKPLNAPSVVLLPESAVSLTGVDDLDYVSALGGINMPKAVRSAPSYAWGWKTTIEGRKSYSSKWVDECWERTQVGVVRPTIVSAEELTNSEFSFSVDGKIFSGKGWGGYSIPKLLWQVTGPIDGVNSEIGAASWTGEADLADANAVSVTGGTNTEAELYKRAEDILVGLSEWLESSSKQIVLSDDAVGPFEFIPVSNYPIDPEGIQPFIPGTGDYGLLIDGLYWGCWDEILKVTAIDACGREGVHEFTPFNLFSPLQVFGTSPNFGGIQISHTATRGAKYEVIAGNGTVDENGVFYYGACGVAATVAITTDCGDRAEITLPPNPDYVPLSISGPTNNVVVGSVFSGGLGVEPYTYSVDKGSINSATGAITATACTPGSVAIVTVTATDACGQTASMEARYQAAGWVLVSRWTSNVSSNWGGDYGPLPPTEERVTILQGTGWQFSLGKVTLTYRANVTGTENLLPCQTPPYPYMGSVSDWCRTTYPPRRFGWQNYYEWRCP